MIQTELQSHVYTIGQTPSLRHASGMASLLYDAWWIQEKQYGEKLGHAYAHPERLTPEGIQDRFTSSDGLVLERDGDIKGMALLIHHKNGVVEAGSIAAESGYGIELIEDVYTFADDQHIPLILFDTASCRTGMERAAIQAADNTRLYIVVPTYISPNVWGEKNQPKDRGKATWGCIGYTAISKNFLKKYGPLQLPMDGLKDGTDAIIDAMVQVGNKIGEKRNISRIFTRNASEANMVNGSLEEITKDLYRVNYYDIEGRKQLLGTEYHPCGIELGMKDGKLLTYVQYSTQAVREGWLGKNGVLFPEAHPNRTNYEPTMAFIHAVRRCRGQN